MSRGRKALLGIVLFSLLVPALTAADPDFKLDPNCFPVFRLSSATLLPDANTTIDLYLEHAIPTSGLNLLVEFDACCLTFVEARQVGKLSGWEHFEYDYSMMASVDHDCPTGHIRLIADADTAEFAPEGRIIELTFGPAPGRQGNCGCVDLKWAWHECEDNTMFALHRDTLYLAYNIDALLPEKECLTIPDPGTRIALPRFMPGQICIPDLGCWRGEGDCDNNGEIDVTDVVYLIQYAFAGGPEPIGNQACTSACRADLNCDGRLNLVDVSMLVQYVFHQPMPAPCCRD